MKNLIQTITILLLIANGTLSWAGWIEDRPDRTVVHVSVWDLPDPTDSATINRAGLESLRQFKKRFPEIFAQQYRARYEQDPVKYGRHRWEHVEIELHKATGISLPGATLDMLSIAGGTPPDVFYINFRRSDNYIRNNFLYPLDEYYATLPPAEIKERVNEKIWPVIRRKGPNGVAHIWALPYGDPVGKVLFYRKDLFNTAGIPYPTADWTWDDLYAAVKKICDPARGISGCRQGAGGFNEFLWSAGGELMTYDAATDQWRCVFGSREAAVALEFYTRLATEKWTDAAGAVHRGYSTVDLSNQYWEKWFRGEVGLMVFYIDRMILTHLDPEVVGIAPIPKGPTGQRAGELNCVMAGLFSQIQETAVRDAGWEYIHWLNCPEAQEINTRVMVEGGLGRFINPQALHRFGYRDLEATASKDAAKDYEIALATGRPEPYGKNSELLAILLNYPISEVLQLAATDQLPVEREARLQAIQKILKKGEDRANAEMIGVRSPRDQWVRRVVAAVALTVIVVTFTFFFRRVWRLFKPPATVAGSTSKGRWRRDLLAYALLVPAVLTILVWSYVPLARGSVMAFLDYHLVGRSTWVGLDNFGNLFFDNFWWQSVWNSLRYSLLVIALTFLPPVVLAIMLQEVPRGSLVYRLIYYLPAIISGLVTMMLWRQFFQPSERGALNALIMKIPALAFLGVGVVLLIIAVAFARRLWCHEWRPAAMGCVIAGILLLITCVVLTQPILLPPLETLAESLRRLPGRLLAVTPEPYRWLSDPKTAMLSCILPMVWAGMGPGSLIYLAALKGIPNDFYEAADIDGAGFIDKILFVIFPTLKPILIINFVGVFIGTWYGAAGSIMVMTGGAGNTEVADLHIFYKAFTSLQFGAATAMAWVLGCLLVGFTVYQLRTLARMDFRSGAGGK